MHSSRAHHHHAFAFSSLASNTAIFALLAVLFLVFLLLFLIITAQPAYAQARVPPTARQAAEMPQFASRLAPNRTISEASRSPVSNRGRASSKYPAALRGRGSRGWLPADNVIYDNGAINGTTDAWSINFGFAVTDSFTVQSNGSSMTGMSFGAWLFPGDVVQTAEVVIGSTPFGNDISDQVVNFTQSGCVGNQYGFNVCTASGNLTTSVSLNGSTYWVTLQNATVNTGDPIYWDENSGPSMASENSIGTIPSEAFTILGSAATSTTTCDPCGPPPPQCFNSDIVIHDFTQEEGGGPSGLALDTHGNLYGTTSRGGSYGYGLVYKVWQSMQAWLFTPLYSFSGTTDGVSPSGVIVGPDGALYGTALGGGTCDGGDCGLVYRITPQPVACPEALCNWKETVLYRFTGDPDGLLPSGNLAFDQAGNLFGTTWYGGAYGLGAVFELTRSTGGWTEQIIYSFTGGSDGATPTSLVVGTDGNLYGLSLQGGDFDCTYLYHPGCGTVFQLAKSGNAWTLNVLHTFAGSNADGSGAANLVQDHAGNLYGISTWNAPGGLTAGIEFMLSQANGSWTFTEVLLRDYTNNGHNTVFTGLATDAMGNTSIAGSDVYPWLFQCTQGYGFFCNWYVLGQHGFGWDDQIFDGAGLVTDPGGKHLYGVTPDCGRYDRGTIWAN